MKPTVSVSSKGCPLGSSIFRVVVSSVAKSMSLAMTSEPDTRESRDDLPALVYPTIAAVATACRSRSLRCVARCRVTMTSSFWMASILARARRRSTSICFSPSPLAAPPPPLPPPEPPPWRSRWLHMRAMRGREYCMRASSTWSVASRVRARLAKMSRMTSSRSITHSSIRRSHSLCWDGASMLSNTTQSAPQSTASCFTS